MLDFNQETKSHPQISGTHAMPREIPEKRWYLAMANESDIYISARLTGREPDFEDMMRKRLSQRHNGALDHVEIVKIMEAVLRG